MKKVSLTMIVKNEERCLARCLESVKPWVDEMIVLDTGSTDRTKEIAREFGATVYERRWTNDFAAARNAALAKSDADWNLVLDADEWIVEGGQYLLGLKQDNRKIVHSVRVDSDLGNQQTHLSTSHHIVRILPKGVRYIGKIHEQPSHRLPGVESSLIARHDGYMPVQVHNKRGRNMELLLEKVKEDPKEPYYVFQLGKEYDVLGEYEKAIDCYEKAYKLFDKRPPWIHDMVIRMIESKKAAGRIEEAMIFASDEMPNWEHSPDFHLTVGSLLLEQMNRRPEQGPHLLPMMEECWLKALSIGDSVELPGSVSGRGSFMAAQQLWALYDARNDIEKATKYDKLYKKLYQDYQASVRHSHETEGETSPT